MAIQILKKVKQNDFNIKNVIIMKTIFENNSDGDDEFGAWCAKALASHNDVIDGE